MMSKRILALLVCLLMCLSTLLGCSAGIPADAEQKGAYITMYLTDEIYNFDPAYAYTNEEAESIVSLMFTAPVVIAALISMDSQNGTTQLATNSLPF